MTPATQAILAMAAATLALRIGGAVLARRLIGVPLLRAWLDHLPGAMFVALIAPALLDGGVAYGGAGLVTLIASRSRLPLAACIALGVGTVLLIRATLPP